MIVSQASQWSLRVVANANAVAPSSNPAEEPSRSLSASNCNSDWAQVFTEGGVGIVLSFVKGGGSGDVAWPGGLPKWIEGHMVSDFGG